MISRPASPQTLESKNEGDDAGRWYGAPSHYGAPSRPFAEIGYNQRVPHLPIGRGLGGSPWQGPGVENVSPTLARPAPAVQRIDARPTLLKASSARSNGNPLFRVPPLPLTPPSPMFEHQIFSSRADCPADSPGS
eukprot:1686500-Rhodomonas_salina.1